MERHDTFGEWLRQRRRTFDLTQADLAERVGFSVSGLRKIESDERRPSRQMAELLAQHLQIPSDERPVFVKVARGVERVERLGSPGPMPVAARFRSAAPRPASNVPIPPTPLIGREHELAALARLLRDPQCRLVTLAGVGGIGKTRLAIAAAAAQQEAFVDGVFFVPLAATHSAEHIAPAIAKAIGFCFSGPLAPYAQLINYLRDRHMLLVLDNLEHLLGGIELLAEMLASLPGLKLLATSRERLNLHAEWVFEVQGLPVPAHDKVEELENFSSAALFLQTVQRSWRHFELTAEDRPHLVRICQLVDGLPLAMELAAGWVRLLSCREIAQEIEHNLDFLATSARDVPERHRSMRAVFDWSWGMLSAGEQQVMQRLSAFRGGFGREAAEQVAGATLPLLSTLVAKSLVYSGTTGRYDMHELLRQYAAAQLEADREACAVRERHAEYYLEYLYQREAMLKSHRQKDALTELNAEINNIRLAWEEATDRGQLARLRQASFCLFYYYEIRGAFQEGETVFRRTAETLQRAKKVGSTNGSAFEVTLAMMLTHQAYFSYRRGKNVEAHAVLGQCIERARLLGDQEVLRFALRYDGEVCGTRGRLEEAEACLRESLELCQAAGQSWEVAITSAYLGRLAYDRGAFDDAEGYLREGLALSRALGDARVTAYSLIVLASVLLAKGQGAAARELAQESLSLTQATGDRYGVGSALFSLGRAMLADGEVHQARALFEDSLALFQEIGDPLSTARAYVLLGHVALTSGDVGAAERCFTTAATVAGEAQIYVLDALAGLALLYAQRGEDALALELAMHVLQNPSTCGEARGRAAHLRAELEARLTPQEVETACAGAERSSLEEIVTMVLERSRSHSIPAILSGSPTYPQLGSYPLDFSVGQAGGSWMIRS
jgi:predicted ATPase/transcriptional regulator with XRE-family HTH domain